MRGKKFQMKVIVLMYKIQDFGWMNISVSTQFRASPFERALFSALNRVSLKN